MTTYRPDPVTQRDGSGLANSNCLMASAAVGLDGETAGRKTSTGAKMREYSGDTSGGTNTDEILRAWSKGYHEAARDRDGHTFDELLDELWDGRLVMIQVWHATVGQVCLSGSGAYGHGMSVAPEQRTVSDGSRQWLVADPWCKPATWSWVDQSKLKAGAEDWAARCAREVAGPSGEIPPDIRLLPLLLVKAAARRLMDRWRPDHPLPPGKPLPEVGGGGGILYATTTASLGGSDDMAIQAPQSLISDYTVQVTKGDPYYRDAGLQQKAGSFGQASTLRYIGLVVDGAARAVVIHTGALYDDGDSRPTIVYVPKGSVDPVDTGDTTPPDVGERDAQWRAWLDGDADAPDKLAQGADTSEAPSAGGSASIKPSRRRSK